jgi:hypothetical protein
MSTDLSRGKIGTTINKVYSGRKMRGSLNIQADRFEVTDRRQEGRNREAGCKRSSPKVKGQEQMADMGKAGNSFGQGSSNLRHPKNIINFT